MIKHISISLKILIIILFTIILQTKVFAYSVGDEIDVMHNGECRVGTLTTYPDYLDAPVYYPDVYNNGFYLFEPTGSSYYSWLTYYGFSVDSLNSAPFCQPCTAPLVRDPITAVCGCPNTNEIFYEGQCLADSDGNGCPDGYSKDFNGVCFPDADNDGVPDDSDPSAGTDGTCAGVDYAFYSISPFTDISPDSFTYIRMVLKGQCVSNYLTLPDVDFVLIRNDTEPTCPNEYCYVHYSNQDCWQLKYWDYYPSPSWVYVNAGSQQTCDALVDGIDYTSSTYVTPNSANCPTTSFCYLLPVDASPDTNNTNTPIAPDANASQAMIDLLPILDAINQTNELMSLSLDKQDVSNDHLGDIKDKITETNSINNDILSELQNNRFDDSRIVGRLDNANGKLDGVNSNLVNQTLLLSRIADSLDKNSTVQVENNVSVDVNVSFDTSKMESNLSFISDALHGDNNYSDTYDDNVSDLIDDTKKLFDNLIKDYNTTATNINGAINTIKGGFSTNMQIQTVNSCSKTYYFDLSTGENAPITFDVCETTSQLQPVVYPIAFISLSVTFIMIIMNLIFGL
ncbi:hypothetical protein [Sulfurovum sp.]|uniref:hypothetical protein n=1 Tax=Sulfurovum sp. TaxID=1969726 RepID=UPI0035663AE3